MQLEEDLQLMKALKESNKDQPNPDQMTYEVFVSS
jgi:hypothetical protein